MAPCALSYASDGGTARICQRGAKFPPPTVGRFFFYLCLKTAFSCTLDTFIRSSVCCGIDQFPTFVIFFILFLMNLFQGNIILSLSYVYSPINGGGGGCILAIPVTVVQPRFVNGGKSEGARGRCGRGVSHGREIFKNLCMKLAFSSTLETIIRGSLCTGIDQFPTLFLCSFFS